MRARRSATAAFLLAAGLAAACSIRQRTHSAADRVSPDPGVSVCVLFFDGLSDEAFTRLVSEGALPNLKARIVDRGLRVQTAVTSVPSETYPNLASLETGLLPGHHGIPANIWLDRKLQVREAHTNILGVFSSTDYLAPEARTLFERLPNDTVAVTVPLARGVTVHARNRITLVASYARNDWSFLDRKTLDDVGDAYSGAAAAERVPPLVWAHFVGPDEVAHVSGPESREFRAAMSEIDRAFARLLRRLKRRHLDERILFVLVGDHGNRTYGTFVDASELVNRALRANPTEADCSLGHCVLVPAAQKEKAYDVGDAMITVGAYRGVMIWLPANRLPEEVPTAFRSPRRKRKARPTASAPLKTPAASLFAATLARAPEVRLVVTRGASPGTVALYGPTGRAEIVREDRDGLESLYVYRVLEGEDPLGYSSSAAAPLVGSAREADEWLEATAETEYPDLVVQLPEFFDSPRSPDVFISPKDGYGFTKGYVAGHGSLSRSETVVPLLFAGPGVPPGILHAARTVDLAPTLLAYLGLAYDPDEMDGEDLEIAPHGIPKAPPILATPA
ncbi:MAG TPA: alkaline phosphatase family protein, partial [Thermoanaerobaculia bacterium]|nr:alkaline phosphatase family protein [Thermoanaerobaculia bacterium]